MLDGLFRDLFGKGSASTPVAPLVVLFRCNAVVLAFARGHADVDVDHVLCNLVGLIDVRPLLSRHGVDPRDVEAVVMQLLDERPHDLARVGEPPLAPRLEAAIACSVGHPDPLRRFIGELARVLPRELAFARGALTTAAPEIAAFFSESSSLTTRGVTLERWDPRLAGVIALMQRRSDDYFQGWQIGVLNLFLALFSAKYLHDAFVARGLDVRALVRDAVAAFQKSAPDTPVRAPPDGHVASISPGLYALFIRAERYAADERRPVNLSHLLAALHDEAEYAPFVERLLQ
jgi:hypothetical protein